MPCYGRIDVAAALMPNPRGGWFEFPWTPRHPSHSASHRALGSGLASSLVLTLSALVPLFFFIQPVCSCFLACLGRSGYWYNTSSQLIDPHQQRENKILSPETKRRTTLMDGGAGGAAER